MSRQEPESHRLAAIEEWVNCKCPVCGADAKRETNTMPQWAGSSWYFLRYVDNHNDKELVSREKADDMLPVDMYIGGVEHAVLHLLYSRFYTKFLYDIGVIDFDEPFQKLFNQGMITGKNGIKMSKSKGNVVSPDDLVRDYGCDSLRMYELFVGPPELDAEWDDRGIDGVNRFLKRFWNLVMDSKEADVQATQRDDQTASQTDLAISPARLESFSLNTVISADLWSITTSSSSWLRKRAESTKRHWRRWQYLLVAVCTSYCRRAVGETGSYRRQYSKQDGRAYDREDERG